MWVLVATAGLVAGCGTTHTTITKAQANSYASVVNLRATDVPGLTAYGREGEFNGLPFGAIVDHCGADVPRSGEVTGVISPIFGVPPTERLYATVYVMRSEALARRAAESAGSSHTRACVTAHWTTHPGQIDHEPYESHVDVSPLRFELPGAQTYGLRESGTLAAVLVGRRTRPLFYGDTVGFAVGASDIVLKARRTTKPFPAATERRLLELLLRRAREHRL